jgi:hypothetical protein
MFLDEATKPYMPVMPEAIVEPLDALIFGQVLICLKNIRHDLTINADTQYFQNNV